MSRASISRFITGGVIATLIGLALAWLPVFAQQPQGPARFDASPLQQASCLDFGAAETARHGSGAMRFIGTRSGNPLAHPQLLDARTPPESAARSYLSVCGSMFGLSGDVAELALQRVTPAENQRSVVRFQQMYGGIPVFGGELIVQLDSNRNLVATTGNVLPRSTLSTRPAVTTAQAVRTALDTVARAHDVSAQQLAAGTPQLWIYSEALVGPGQGPPRLVWRTEVTSTVLRPIRELVLVDAARGGVTLHFNQAETAKQRQTFTANNTTTLPGTLVCDESNPTCAGGDAHAASAHVSAGDTYDFYLSHHGRDGMTGTGAVVSSTVHYSVGYANAFWSGSQLVYGDGVGFALADDVVGHEWTHGVTQYTSGLFYYYQSGAINESLSDIWGEFVDLTNGRGNDAANERWLMGEDATGSGAIRSLINPPAYGDPDRIRSPLYSRSSSDNGGVHTNSGVNNKAAYLMVDGGIFNGQTVLPLGIVKTAKIYYEAQTNLLTSGSDYEDLYNALFQACNNLIGTSNIVAADCDEVRKATLAVEMNLQPVAGFNTEAPVCLPGQNPITTFFDDLESGPGNFSTIVGTGTNRWTYDSNYAHSGQHAMFAADVPSAVTDSSIALTAGVTVPGNGFLHFAHAYGFENPAFDGGVVEYSVDGGAWLDAGPLFDNVGYTGVVTSGFSNPLAGRAAFIGDSHGYIASRLNLASLAGQSVRFRWRIGLDILGPNLGWFLDDVRIYSCAAASVPPGVPQSPTPGDGATGVSTNQGLTWSAAGAATYDVAFGTADPPPPVATGLGAANYVPTLAPNTTYFWRVIANNSAGSTPGPLWTFATGAAPADLIAWDTFTGAGSLTSHSPDLNLGGGFWSVTGGPPTPTLSGGLVGVTAGTGHVQATLQTGRADVSIGVDYRVGTSTQRLAGLAFRFADVNNHLLLLFYENALHFYRRQNGGFELLASSPALTPVAGGSTQRIEVRTLGSALTGWWNGVQVVQAVETFQQTATRHGLDWNTSFDFAARFDNLEIRGAAPVPPSPPAVPATPSPANGAIGAATTATLTWVATGATSYDVAFGTVNPPPPAATGLASASYSPVMAGATTYYWRVTARNASGPTTGPVWTFTTGAAPADLLVTDSFTGAGALTSHTPDVNASGAPWTVTGGPPSPTLTGGVVGIAAGGGHVQATLQTNVADIRMGVDYRVGASSQRLAGLAFRLTDANNHLLLLFFDNALHFYRRQNGTYSLLASSGPLAPIAGGTTQRMEVRASGTTLTGWWNGAQVVQASDTIQQTATRHGLDWNTAFDSATTFDNLEIRNAGAPVTPPAVPATPSPANAATGVATNATMSWSATGATIYDVAFGIVNPPPPVTTGQSGATYTPAAMANSTTYYWQVTARNAGGSTPGPVWSFTTAAPNVPSAPGAPALIGPVDGASGLPTNPLLTWAAATGATSYDLALGTVNPPPTLDTGINSTAYMPTLAGDTTYFWRVTARNASGSTPSPVWSFTTAAFPADVVVTDTFTGTGSLTSHTPDLNVNASPWIVTGGSPTPVLSGGVVGITSGTSHVQATLDTGLADIRLAVDYRVGSGSEPLAGLVFRFSDVNNHLLLLFYQNGLHFYRRQSGNYILLGSSGMGPVASGSTHRLEVRTSGTTVTSYWDGVVQFGVADALQQTATRHGLDWNPGVDTSSTFDNLEIRNNGTPVTLPGAPGNPSPSNTATGVATNATMSWSATGATSYDVAFGTVNPPPPVTTAQSGTTYTPPPMASSTTYFWRVTTRNAGGSTTGPVWTFTTGTPPPPPPPPLPPGAPATPSPSNAATGVATTAALTWSAPGATSYDVAFGTLNPPPAVATNLTNATYSPTMTASTTYFWRVTARNGGGSTAGPVWSFTTAALPADLVVSDSFTGTGPLTSHAPDVNQVGTPWQVHGATGTPALSGGRVGITAGSGHVQAVIVSAVADIRMGVDYHVGTSPNQMASLVFRFIDTNHHSLLMFYDNALHLYRRQNGVYTLLASSAPLPPVPSGSVHRLEVRTSGSQLTGWWDGVQMVAATSSFMQPATMHGVGWNTAFDPSATFDNFEIRDAHVVSPPGAPGNPSPSNVATGVATNATMSWSATGATSYDVAFGTVNPPPPVTTAQSGTTYTPPPMATSTTYFWQVTARNAGGSTAGPVWSFTTGAPPLPAPGVPATPSPANAATGVATTAALTWSASGATTYDVAFGTANPPPSVATALTSATHSPAMAASTTYFWRVIARNSGGSTVGPVWSFTTAVPPADLVVSDSFTGTGPLTSHAPDVNQPGMSWQVHGATGTPALSGGRVSITPGSGHVQAVIVSGVADMRMGVDYHVGTSPNQMASLVFRFLDTNHHSLLMFYDNALHLYRRQAGVYTLLASSAPLPPVPSGSVRRLEVRTSGTQVTGWWDGVQMVAATSAFLQPATMHGVAWNTAFDPSATFDNFEIRNAHALPDAPANPNPASAAVGVATSATLSWSATGATNYDVYFGTANPPSLVSFNQTNATYAPILAAGATYFWRVVARNAGGTTSGPVWAFTTVAPPAVPSAPVLIGPPDGETGIWINAPLTWSSAGATSYDLALGTVNPPPPLVAGLTSATYSPTTAINTTYFWRVTARNAAGSTTGPVWTFDTNVPPNLVVRDRFTGPSGAPLSGHAPEINLPGSRWSITGSPTSPTLINGRVGATVGSQHVQATLLIGIPDVEMAVDYYPGTGQPLAGLVFRFTDENNHHLLLFFQNALHLYQRSGGTYTLLSSSPPLAPVVPGNGYRLAVRASGTQLTGWWNGMPVVQATASSPTGGPRYGLDWNPAVDSTSTFDSLEIINIGALPPLPGAPATPSPANGATGVIPGPQLQWSSTDAVTYDLSIGTAMPPPVLATGLTSPTLLMAPVLTPNTQYFWQVTARNAHGPTTGPIWSFTTAPGAAVPGVPVLVAPADGSTGFPITALMQWSATGATTYDVAFGTVSPPPAWASGLAQTWASPAMYPNTRYFWRVTARNANGSTAGPIWSFTTAGPMPQLLASDTFTGADGTLLSAHTPDVGGGVWSITGTPPFPTLNGGLVGVTTGTTRTQATLSLGMQVNVRMAVDYRAGTGPNHQAGLVFRFIDVNNYLLLVFDQNVLRFYRRQVGVTTLLASSSVLTPPAPGTTHRLEMRATGGILTGVWDGVPVVQSGDSNLITGTRFGLDWNPAVDSTAAFDNLEIYNMGAP
jgi:Zn-dependent metalloprotease